MVPTLEPPREPGTRVGCYVLRSLIARGGFGAVYEAQGPTGEAVAVKVLHANLCDSTASVSRFAREVEVVRRVHHRNVVRILDAGTDSGVPFLVTELLHGRDLDARIRAQGALSVSEAVRVFESLCAALSAAHDVGIVHRDVKASNVFLCSDTDRIVLLDFGIAKLVDNSGPQLTMSREVIGTLAAMAPEQLRGEAVDQRTDVYALGVLAYTMLVGTPPFAEESPTILRYMHSHARRPRASSRGCVTSVMDSVISQAMAISRDDRPRSVALFLQKFREAAGVGVCTGASTAIECAIYATVDCSSNQLAAPDEPTVSRLAAARDRLARVLQSHGCETIFSTASEVLSVLPDVGESAQQLQAGLATIAQGDESALGWRICMRFGQVERRDSRVVDGEVFRMGAWPKCPSAGVWGAPSVISAACDPGPDANSLVRFELQRQAN